MKSLNKIVAIAAGQGHLGAVALNANGDVYCWGKNHLGQLGNGRKTNSELPAKVNGIGRCIEVAGGYLRTYAIDEGGCIWRWGWNNYLQHDSVKNNIDMRPVRERVGNYDDVAALSIERFGAFVLDETGAAWRWGPGWRYDSIIGRDVRRVNKIYDIRNIIRMRSCYQGTIALTNNGSVWLLGYHSFSGNDITPVKKEGLPRIVDIAKGMNHALALDEYGRIWAWGCNFDGQLGVGKEIRKSAKPVRIMSIDDVIAIAAGPCHSMALTKDNTVWFWGENSDGQCGRTINDRIYKPRKAQ